LVVMLLDASLNSSQGLRDEPSNDNNGILYIKATVVFVYLSVFYLSLTSFDSWPLFLWYPLSSSFSQFFTA
jgi:hypothetical protein